MPKNVQQYELKRWIICSLKNNQIGVEGFRTDSEEPNPWKSTAIVHRINHLTVKSNTGSLYKLCGQMDKDLALEAGLSQDIIQEFQNGFPENWKLKTSKYFDNDVNSSNDQQKSFQSGTESPQYLCSAKKLSTHQTRSGRKVIPPLAWWVGERMVSPQSNAGTSLYVTISPSVQPDKEKHLLPKSVLERHSLKQNAPDKSFRESKQHSLMHKDLANLSEAVEKQSACKDSQQETKINQQKKESHSNKTVSKEGTTNFLGTFTKPNVNKYLNKNQPQKQKPRVLKGPKKNKMLKMKPTSASYTPRLPKSSSKKNSQNNSLRQTCKTLDFSEKSLNFEELNNNFEQNVVNYNSDDTTLPYDVDDSTILNRNLKLIYNDKHYECDNNDMTFKASSENDLNLQNSKQTETDGIKSKNKNNKHKLICNQPTSEKQPIKKLSNKMFKDENSSKQTQNLSQKNSSSPIRNKHGVKHRLAQKRKAPENISSNKDVMLENDASQKSGYEESVISDIIEVENLKSDINGETRRQNEMSLPNEKKQLYSKTSSEKNDILTSVPCQITAKKGTIKRKKQFLSYLSDMKNNHEDDFFNTTPSQINEDFPNNRVHKPACTPPSGFFSLKPRSETASPVSDLYYSEQVNNNVRSSLSYLYRRNLWRKEAKKQGSNDAKRYEQEKPSPQAAVVFCKSNFPQTMYNQLSQSKQDSEEFEDEDVYFSDDETVYFYKNHVE